MEQNINEMELERIVDHVSKNLNRLPDMVDEFVDKNKIEMQNLGRIVGSTLQQTESDIEQGLILGTDDLKDIDKKSEMMVDKVTEKVNQYEGKTAEELTAILIERDKREQLYKEDLSQMHDTLTQVQEKLERLTRPLHVKVADEVRAAWDVAKNITIRVVGFVKDIGSDIKDFAQNTIQAAQGAAKAFHEAASKFFDEKIKQPIKETVQSMRDAVDTAKNVIAKGITKAEISIEQKRSEFMEYLAQPFVRQMQMSDDRISQLNQRLNNLERDGKDTHEQE